MRFQPFTWEIVAFVTEIQFPLFHAALVYFTVGAPASFEVLSTRYALHAFRLEMVLGKMLIEPFG